MATVVDRVYLDINGTEVACSSIDTKKSHDPKLVEAMTRDGNAIGYVFGVAKYEITAEVPVDLDSEVDLDGLWKSKALFSAGVEEEGGGIEKYTSCVIKEIGKTGKTGDHAVKKLTILALELTT